MNRLRALARTSRDACSEAALLERWLRLVKETKPDPEVRRVLAQRMKEPNDA